MSIEIRPVTNSGGTPGGSAGGDLGGTYPNPTVLSAGSGTGSFTAGSIGVGTTPAFALHLADTAGLVGDIEADTAGCSLNFRSYARFSFTGPLRANGTKAAPTALLSGDEIGRFRAGGHNGTSFVGTRAALRFFASENWSAGVNGTNVTLQVTPNGTASQIDAVKVNNNGNIGIGTAADPTQKLQVEGGNVSIATAGNGVRVAEGTNAKMGTAVLVNGTVVVSNTSVTAVSRIFLTSNVDGGTGPLGALRISARTAGTSFTITSSVATDGSTVAWMIFEPA